MHRGTGAGCRLNRENKLNLKHLIAPPTSRLREEAVRQHPPFTVILTSSGILDFSIYHFFFLSLSFLYIWNSSVLFFSHPSSLIHHLLNSPSASISRTAMMGSDNSSYELGNTVAVEAHEAGVSMEVKPFSARSSNGYADSDQLARLWARNRFSRYTISSLTYSLYYISLIPLLTTPLE
jgi:hypothetical protein